MKKLSFAIVALLGIGLFSCAGGTSSEANTEENIENTGTELKTTPDTPAPTEIEESIDAVPAEIYDTLAAEFADTLATEVADSLAY